MGCQPGLSSHKLSTNGGIRFEKKRTSPGWITSLWTRSSTIIYGHTKLQGIWIDPTWVSWIDQSLIIQEWQWKQRHLIERVRQVGRIFQWFHFLSISKQSQTFRPIVKDKREHLYGRPVQSPAKLAGEKVQLVLSTKFLSDHRCMGSTGETMWICNCLMDLHWTSLMPFAAFKPLGSI